MWNFFLLSFDFWNSMLTLEFLRACLGLSMCSLGGSFTVVSVEGIIDYSYHLVARRTGERLSFINQITVLLFIFCARTDHYVNDHHEISRIPIFSLTGWVCYTVHTLTDRWPISCSPCQFLQLFTKCILTALGDKSVIDSFDRSVSTLVCLHLTSWHDLSIIFDISIYPEIIKSIVSTDNGSIHGPL